MSWWAAKFFEKHPVFSHAEFLAESERHGSGDIGTAQVLLTYWQRRQRIVRVRRGLYAVADRSPSIERSVLIASRAADDAVLAGHTALAIHTDFKLHSEDWPMIFLTRSRARPFTCEGDHFIPIRVDSEGVLQFRVATVSDVKVKVSPLERAMVDSLDRVSILGWRDTWRLMEAVPRKALKLDKVIAYALSLGNAVLIGKLGFFLERRQYELRVSAQVLKKLRRRVPAKPRLSGSLELERGRVASGWNVMVPESVWRGDFQPDSGQ